MALSGSSMLNDMDDKQMAVTEKYCPTEMPKDRWHVVFWTFLLLGTGAILPWNMFINAEAYYTNYKFAVDLEYAKNYLAYVGICAQVPNLLMSLINCLLPSKSGLLKRAGYMLGLMGVVITVTCIMPSVDTSSWINGFFVLTMLSVTLTASGTGMLQNCLYGLAADFPMTYSNAVILGSNASGVLTSVLYLISLIVSPSYQVTATIYFSLALLTICWCIVMLLLLKRNDYFRYVHSKSVSAKKSSDAEQTLSTKKHIVQTIGEFWKVVSHIKIQLFNIFFVFFVSLNIFPTIMAGVKALDENFILGEKYFAAVTCFLSFNVFSLLGNVISNYVQYPGPKRLWMPIVLRGLFVPFFLFCNFRPIYRTLPVLIQSDVAYIIFAMLMALSSGYFASLTMMYIPKLVPQDKCRTAGMLGALFLVLGILCGVNFVFVINYINENLGPCTAAIAINATAPVCP